MDIKLPDKTSGQEAYVLRNARQVTLIGANGSGKSRFCDWLVDKCGDKAYRISALKALFPQTEPSHLKGSIDYLFEQVNKSNSLAQSDAKTEFDKLTYIMLADEFRELMNYKAHLLMGDDVAFPKTLLDKTVKMWQEIFPQNKILRANGKLMFTTEGHKDTYSALRLSDGERTVLYYIGAVLYAMPEAVIFVDDPETFIHPSIMQALWNVIEVMRPDCTFIYNTHDVDFASSRIDNKCVWVKSYEPAQATWDYEVFEPGSQLSDNLYFDILGTRKPVLFIEGDATHSIDNRLYPLIFPDYTVKPLGSCEKVIESVRSFNDLRSFHHLDSWGIVDRDRRGAQEVQYLRDKKILVPNVAEIENILMLSDVIAAVAHARRRKENAVLTKVKAAVIDMFRRDLHKQALMHVRHKVKHDVEVRIDMRFRNINALEEHMVDLVNEINPRGTYNELCRQFRTYADSGDYLQVLRVYNEKTMLVTSNVAHLCGLASKDEYIKTVLNILKSEREEAQTIRRAIKRCFGIDEDSPFIAQPPKQ